MESLSRPLRPSPSWIRRHLPALTLLLLAPSIPELLTGSTPITELAYNPVGFGIGFLLDIVLYGTGALLIREFAAAYGKGWGSVLLLGAAYGIAEEGFEVHTFFQPSGSPVGPLGSYGHLWGVNWLWALVLTVFHATYSIALPILLTQLWFPDVKWSRWLGRRTIALLAVVFAIEVVLFGFLVGHGPSRLALVFFVAVVTVLLTLACWLPRASLRPRAGPRRVGGRWLVLLGAVEFIAYSFVLLFASAHVIPAVAAAGVYVLANLGALYLLLRVVGTEDLERSEFLFAVGMLAALFARDVVLEVLNLVPGIVAVAAVFVYILYRLDRTLKARHALLTVPAGAVGGPPLGT